MQIPWNTNFCNGAPTSPHQPLQRVGNGLQYHPPEENMASFWRKVSCRCLASVPIVLECLFRVRRARRPGPTWWRPVLCQASAYPYSFQKISTLRNKRPTSKKLREQIHGIYHCPGIAAFLSLWSILAIFILGCQKVLLILLRWFRKVTLKQSITNSTPIFTNLTEFILLFCRLFLFCFQIF